MKKSLIALAAATAVGGAFAQSSVTLYGVVDAGYAVKKWSDDTFGVTKSQGVQDGAAAGNRFGFRGTEDLGGGLRGEFVIEQGISITSAQLTNVRTSNSGHQIDGLSQAGPYAEGGRSSTSLNRQSYVGLGGGFGTVRLGYQYTNLYELSTLSGYQLTSEGVHGADQAHVWGQQFLGGTRANGITYISPTILGGLSVRLQYGAGADLNSYESDLNGTRKQDRIGVMAQYRSGPLSAAVAYTEYTTEAAQGSLGAGGFITANSAKNKGKLTQVGASYDFGVARVAGTYNNGSTTTTNADFNSWQIGVRVPFGAAAFIAGYGRGSLDVGAANDVNDFKQVQVAVTYDLSKRTQAYAYYGETKDDGVGSATSPAWDKKTHFIAGVRHSF
jgi:predicted porin